MKGIHVVFCKVSSESRFTGGERFDMQLRQETLAIPGVEVHDFTLSPHRPIGRRSLFWKLTAPLLALRHGLAFRRKLKARHAPEKTVWVFNTSKAQYFTLLLKALRRKGYIAIGITHHPLYLERHGIERRLAMATERDFVENVSLSVAPSPYMMQVLSEWLQASATPHPVCLLHTWFTDSIPLTAKRQDSQHQELGDCTATCEDFTHGHLLWMGGIEMRKGAHHLPELARLLVASGWKGRIHAVGRDADPVYADNVRKNSRGLPIIWHGFVNEEDKWRIASRCKLTLSTASAEGYGVALVEPMVFGLPLVAFNNTAHPLLTGRSERGLLVPDGNVEAMAGAVNTILRHPETLATMQSECREFAMSLPDKRDFRARWRQIFSTLVQTQHTPT